MEDPNNCPKPDCGRPESTSRQHAGKRLSICGNGHSWDAADLAAQRAKAKEAERQEVGIDLGRYTETLKRMEREFRGYGGPMVPPGSLK